MEVFYKTREANGIQAEVERLAGFKYLNMIRRFAKEFSMDPDVVYLKSFNTVRNFSLLFKEESEFNDRYSEITKPSSLD